MGAPIYQNAASYGYSGQGDLGVEKESTAKSGTIEAVSAETKAKQAAEKKRLNTKTKDTEAKTVKQGRLSRKEAVKTAKNAAKSKRDAKLDKPNMDLEGAVGKRKEARATKRQEMQDIRNQERGARREDRANRRVKRIGDRNNMTVGEATKVYNERQDALGGFQKGERGPDPANINKQKVVESNNEATELANTKAKNEDNNSWTKVDGPESTQNKQEIVSGISGPSMLDGPSQQAASEDSGGLGTYMLDSKNRRGR
jgi:hypothetical protein